MLVRQTDYKENFEVSRQFYEHKLNELMKFNGTQQADDDQNHYRAENKAFGDGSSIVTVQIRVVNRVYNIEDQLHGLYFNQNDPSIQEYEIIRDTIDYITQKYLIIPYSIQIQFQLFTIFLYLPTVYNYLLIVDPVKLEEQNLTGFLVTSATVLLIVEIFFVTKLILEIGFMNNLTNQSTGLNQQITLVDIVITKTILSEKILSIANNAGLIQTSFIIQQNIRNNLLLDSAGMRIILVSCFICIFNLINFLSYFSFTQKLVITLIEIFKDLRWTMFVAFTLILCLTCTIWGIENLKHYLIDATILQEVTLLMSQSKSWIIPYRMINYNFFGTLQYSISLALMGDTYIFQEQYLLISLLNEDEVKAIPELVEGIKVIQSLEIIWQAIVIIVIVAYIVVLLNFVIAIMADTQGKVTENFLMQTQRLKASQLIEWHWLLQIQIHQQMSKEELWFQPWKVALLNPSSDGDEDWNGQIQAIKKFVGGHIKRVEMRVDTLNQVSKDTEKKVDELNYSMDHVKQDLSQIKESIKLLLERGRINPDEFESANEL